MNVDKSMEAVRRYGALIGDLDAPSQQEYVQALADREFLDEYIPKGRWGWDKPALLLRFMHEVCCIPLWQARECAIIVVRTNRSHEIDLKLSSDVAAEIAEDTGNVLVAEVTASLYTEAAEGSGWHSWWQDVSQTLRYGIPVGEGSGRDEGYSMKRDFLH